MRTLPIRVAPVPGEALDSWLRALARRSDAGWGDLLAAVGLSGGEAGTPHYWNTTLTDTGLASVAQAAGLSVEVVSDMVLNRYVGTVFDLDGRGRPVPRPPFGRLRGSRYCPRCVVECGERWPLRWRLGWTFCCIRHRVLLADRCPECGRVQRRYGLVGDTAPAPTGCDQRTGNGIRTSCPGDLRKADVLELRPDHPALVAQELIDEVIAAGTGRFGIYRAHPRPAREVLDSIAEITGLALRFDDGHELARHIPADLPGALQPDDSSSLLWLAGNDAAAAAIGVVTAMTILDRPDIDAAADAARWLLRRTDSSQPLLGAWPKQPGSVWAAVRMKAVAASAKPCDQLRYRVGTEFPRRPPPGREVAHRLARRVPTMLWREFSVRFDIAGSTEPYVRGPLAAAVMLVGTNLSRLDAAAIIGAGPNGTTPSTRNTTHPTNH